MSRASNATRALARARLQAAVAKRREQKFHKLVTHGNYKQLRYSSLKKQFSWRFLSLPKSRALRNQRLKEIGAATAARRFFRSGFVFRCSFCCFFGKEIKRGT